MVCYDLLDFLIVGVYSVLVMYNNKLFFTTTTTTPLGV